MGATLEIRELSLTFGGVQALRGIDLSLEPGDCLGLAGPNGSGKSSLVNVLSGHYPPDTGRIHLGGRDVTGALPDRLNRLGLSRTFQTPRFYKRMTVAENLRAALHAHRHWREAFWLPRRQVRAEGTRVRDHLARFGLADRADDMPGALTLIDLRLLEVARAVFAGPQLVLLDEPAAGMTDAETGHLAQMLAAHVLPGHSVILIEHKLDLLETLCSRLAVLQSGRKIADGPAARVLAEERVRRLLCGGPVDA